MPVDDVVEQVLGEPHQVPARVDRLVFVDADLSFENLAAQRVDALALLVHHVVVLEQVLADGEVLRLDLLLGALDGARHHLVLDRNALLHPEALHQARDAIRPEDPHQVVFEREVEARGAGIALPPGAAAQLVVDAPRLVPLGAEDVESADGDDLLVLGLRLAPEEPEDTLPVGARRPVEMVDVEEVDELLVVHEPCLALGQLLGDFLAEALLPRHVFGVAAEQDVGAAAGHVRRDRDRVLRGPPARRSRLPARGTWRSARRA